MTVATHKPASRKKAATKREAKTRRKKISCEELVRWMKRTHEFQGIILENLEEACRAGKPIWPSPLMCLARENMQVGDSCEADCDDENDPG